MSVPGFAFADSVGAQAPGVESVAPSVSEMTLAAFAAKIKVSKPVVDSLLVALGGDETLLAEDFAYLQNEDVLAAFEAMRFGDAPANALQKAQAMRLYRTVQKSAVEGGAPLPGISLAPKVVEQPMDKKEAEPAGSGPLLLRYSSYLNQAAEGHFPLLSPATLREFREEYVNVVGTPPNAAERPTDEQLSALSAMLRSGRSPFADFAVFGAFDEHSAKLRKYTDQVFVGGVLQTRLLHGPAGFDDWKSCWGIFKAAMIMLKAARIGPLSAYEEGIRQLVVTYSEWAVVSQADVQMRSVEWNIVLDELNLQDNPRPWDEVLKATAFGNVSGPRAHWWWTHVVGPLSKGTARGAVATNVVENLEQRPNHVGPILPMGKNKRSKTNKGTGSASHSAEVCFPWNDGGCTAPCPNGRQHRCRYCGGSNHRGKDCLQNAGKNKGKGGGKHGKGGNGKGNGNTSGKKRRRSDKVGKAPTK